MPYSTAARSRDRALVLMSGVIVGVLTVAVLYWAQQVLIPVAVAIIVAFLLNPLVMRLQRWGLPRIVAVTAVSAITLCVVAAFAWLVVSQLSSLTSDLPSYTENIRKKIQSIASMRDSTVWPRLSNMLQELGIHGGAPKAANPEAGLSQPGASPSAPVPVVIATTEPAWLRLLPNFFGPATEVLGQIGLIAVLVVFVLLAREDLRNRFIRLVGHGRLTLTTKAVDDASQRLGRFLLAQLGLNIAFGVCVTIGLALIGVPFALLWGFLGTLMRYVPYVGSPLAALFPVLLSIAHFDSWLEPCLVAGLILGLEVIAANVFEPWVFGHSIGVSAVALLISAAFWAFLWGPVGLVLSCPLTVCLIVLGKYVPQLTFLTILLGDQPPLDEKSTFYQRLSAHDEDEATDIALRYVKNHPADEVYDALLLPALTFANRDQRQSGLDADDVRFIQDATRNVLEDVGEARVERRDLEAQGERASGSESHEDVLVLGIPARDENDEIALEMLGQLLEGESCQLSVLSSDLLISEVIKKVEEVRPGAVCIGAMPPGGAARTRFLFKKLRARFPTLHVLIGRWGPMEAEVASDRPNEEKPPYQVQTSLLQTRDALVAWLPALAEVDEDAIPEAKPDVLQPLANRENPSPDELMTVTSG